MENVYMIAAGGTGGHFYPGFALGKKLIERGHDVVFIVKKDSDSVRILREADIPYHEIDFTGMPRGKNIKKWIEFFDKLFGSIIEVRQYIKSYKPLACIGMGGYISFPLVFTAHFMGVKTAVHDSNAKIGLANRVCAKFADVFLLGMPTVDKIKKSILVGTPIREEFRQQESVEEQNYWKIETDFAINTLIVGGSQGAKYLNYSAAKMVMAITKKTERMHFFHITGRRDYEEIKAFYGDTPNVEVMPYADDIYALMKAAQIIISRSGASSLAEIISLKKPSILVPFPYAAEDHQYYNAKVLADRNCAIVVRETPRLQEDITEAVKALVAHPENLKKMIADFDNARLPDPLDASDYAANILEKLVQNQKIF
jgi:undecaprenyldiphospho-muramoylpentapeptide beta-N-acetylglucosaminyltransferase